MEYPNHDISIQVDAANPGEFFACCGLLELADRLSSGAEGWFDSDRFFVAFLDPSRAVTVQEILWALVNANVERTSEDDDKESPLRLSGSVDFRIDWWIDSNGRNNALKTWAGNQDSLKMFSKWESPLKEILEDENPNPSELFQAQMTLQGPYGFDPKFGWDALSVGFSLNEHTRYKKSQTRPVVEILGAIGIQRFAPDMTAGYGTARYSTWKVPLLPSVARLAVVSRLPDTSLEEMESRTTKRGSYKGLDIARPQ